MSQTGNDHLIVRLAVIVCTGLSFIYGCKEKRALQVVLGHCRSH